MTLQMVMGGLVSAASPLSASPRLLVLEPPLRSRAVRTPLQVIGKLSREIRN